MMFSLNIRQYLVNPTAISGYRAPWRFNHQLQAEELRLLIDQEISDHRNKGRLPTTFTLTDAKYYQALSRIRGRSDRLAYLRSLIPIIKTPPVFAAPVDSGGVHTGFLSPFRALRQPDLVDMSTWNYLRAQRLDENLYFNCTGVASRPLAQLLIDMRAKFNLLSEPWWPILVGPSNDTHKEVIDLLQTKHQLHGSHLYAWEVREEVPNTKDLTLICANRGETIFEMDPNIKYMVQIDADEKQCCLGNATSDSDHVYKNIVKLESRIKSFSFSRRMGTLDLFSVLAQLKMKGFFYKKMQKDNDDENYNTKWKPRSGLISN